MIPYLRVLLFCFCILVSFAQAAQARTIVLNGANHLIGYQNQLLYFGSGTKLTALDLNGNTRWSLPIKPPSSAVMNDAGLFLAEGKTIQHVTQNGKRQLYYTLPFPLHPDVPLEFGSSPVTNIGILFATLSFTPGQTCSYLIALQLQNKRELWRRTNCPVPGKTTEFPFPDRVDVGLTQFAVMGSGVPINLRIYDQLTLQLQQSFSTPVNPPDEQEIQQLSQAFPQGLDYLDSRHPWNCPIILGDVVAEHMIYRCGLTQLETQISPSVTTITLNSP